MLRELSRLFQRLLFAADIVLVCLAWIAAYYLRFEILASWPVPLPEWLPVGRYLSFLPWIAGVAAVVFWSSGLYIADRAQRLTQLIASVAKAFGVALLILMAFFSLYRNLYVSRLTIIHFAVLTPLLMVALRLALYVFVRRARSQGRNLRRVLIIGAGVAGRRLAASFEAYPWMGYKVVGFLDDRKRAESDVLGPTADAARFVDEANPEIDYVYIALPLSAAERIETLLGELSTRLVHVCLVPDLLQYDIINSRITDVDGLPVLHITDEAPLDAGRLAKRTVDVAFSALVIIVLLPVLLLIALAVRLSSPGPVFYRQERMGLNGLRFQMLKFRSMPVDAEAATGAVWASSADRRPTRVGKWLRRTSLDELPQFINVLKGDMSVVGPRPERPVFIEQFKTQVPRYMLRHKMKAGITGWAQVNGWRGNTSIEKRIQYDLYYIQNWSLGLDLRIMLMTVWKGFVSKHAY